MRIRINGPKKLSEFDSYGMASKFSTLYSMADEEVKIGQYLNFSTYRGVYNFI